MSLNVLCLQCAQYKKMVIVCFSVIVAKVNSGDAASRWKIDNRYHCAIGQKKKPAVIKLVAYFCYCSVAPTGKLKFIFRLPAPLISLGRRASIDVERCYTGCNLSAWEWRFHKYCLFQTNLLFDSFVRPAVIQDPCTSNVAALLTRWLSIYI